MKEIQDTVKALKLQMEDIEKKDREAESNELTKDDDDDNEPEQSHALLIKEKENRLQILTEKDQKEVQNATQAPAAHTATNTSATTEISATARLNEINQKEKAAKFERFVNTQRKKQQDAKDLPSLSTNDHAFQNKANEVPGASLNWNGTSKKDPTTDLVIVQDFHQVKSIPNSLGEPAKQQPTTPGDNKPVEKKATEGRSPVGFFKWMFGGVASTIQSLFQKLW